MGSLCASVGDGEGRGQVVTQGEGSRESLREIWLAGGCFWGTEAFFRRLPGVHSAVSGYANGTVPHPSYEDVCTGQTGHAEAVHVVYDSDRIALREILKLYFRTIDPTVRNRQGNDVGTQYRTGIYYQEESDRPVIDSVVAEERRRWTKPIVTEVMPLTAFYPAEEYHQRYLEKNPGGYCHVDLSLASLDEVYKRPQDKVIRESLTEHQYNVTQRGGTEPPFENAYWDNKAPGLYVDIVTGEPLFSSQDKYDSGSGWPSFTQPITDDAVEEREDTSHGMRRREVLSRRGRTHLGHVFSDGPAEAGGLRYCMNSAALRFVPLEDMEAEGYGRYIALVKRS